LTNPLAGIEDIRRLLHSSDTDSVIGSGIRRSFNVLDGSAHSNVSERQR
jgi:hypothetical protein